MRVSCASVGGPDQHLPAEDDSTRTLDVVIEALVGIPISVQVIESLLALKVLKLHHHVGEDLGGGLHELVHELLLLGNRDALGAQAEVERVLEICLVGGAAVEHNGQRLVRVDAGGRRVQG